MNKIIEAAKEAVKIAKCDHEMIPQPRRTRNSKLDRFYCPKCGGTFYQPNELSR